MKRLPMVVSIVAVALLVLLATACDPDDPASAGGSTDGSTIAVRDYEFQPATTTVEAGETVTWIWEGSASHNVVGQGFQSQDQSSGSFKHAFDVPGTYDYQCTIHPGMGGTVTVMEAPA